MIQNVFFQTNADSKCANELKNKKVISEVKFGQHPFQSNKKLPNRQVQVDDDYQDSNYFGTLSTDKITVILSTIIQC